MLSLKMKATLGAPPLGAFNSKRGGGVARVPLPSTVQDPAGAQGHPVVYWNDATTVGVDDLRLTAPLIEGGDPGHWGDDQIGAINRTDCLPPALLCAHRGQGCAKVFARLQGLAAEPLGGLADAR